jgi:hypothetical protein
MLILRGIVLVVLIPISPYLPIFNLAFTSATRGLYTARSLHQPYFEAKKMSPLEVELWLEERKWGYRGKYHFAGTSTRIDPLRDSIRNGS